MKTSHLSGEPEAGLQTKAKAGDDESGQFRWNEDAMCKFFGKPKRLEKVNMEARMTELGLDLFFGPECWPDMAAVRELATKVKSITGDGNCNPFVQVELRK